MAELPIRSHKQLYGPDDPNTSGADGYRWRVWLTEEDADMPVIVDVDLSGSESIGVDLTGPRLHAAIPAALQRLAARQELRNDLDVLEQVAGWDSPLVLRRHDFD